MKLRGNKEEVILLLIFKIDKLKKLIIKACYESEEIIKQNISNIDQKIANVF